MRRDMAISRNAIPTGIPCVDELSIGSPGFRASQVVQKQDDSEKLWYLLDMVIKNCRCMKTVSFSYIFILFNKQTNRHHVTCLFAYSAFPCIIYGLYYFFDFF